MNSFRNLHTIRSIHQVMRGSTHLTRLFSFPYCQHKASAPIIPTRSFSWKLSTSKKQDIKTNLKEEIKEDGMEVGNPVYKQESTQEWKSPHQVEKVPLTWSYVHGASARPMLGCSIGERLDRAAEKTPNADAFIFHKAQKKFTFEQFVKAVCTSIFI